MKKIIYICDKCGTEFQSETNLDTIYIPYDFKSYGLITKKMELCHKCQIKWAQLGLQYLAESEA